MSLRLRIHKFKKKIRNDISHSKVHEYFNDDNPKTRLRHLCKAGYSGELQLQKKHFCQKENYPIDFVVTWVDGNDSTWLQKKEEYAKKLSIAQRGSNPKARYRDWGYFPYWFRAVEKYAPWVNKVFLVTNGQIPSWIKTDCPKLRIVTHEEFIPSEFLPTFSSRPIELNLWRIADLSEHFVYFNDDVFLNQSVKKEDFFFNGFPQFYVNTRPIFTHDTMSTYEHALLNNLGLCNSSFNLRHVMEQNPTKWFSSKYGERVEYNKRVYLDNRLSGLHSSHLWFSYRKSSMEQCCKEFSKAVYATCMNKFRDYTDINIQIFQLWDLLHNTFEPLAQEPGESWNINKKNLSGISLSLVNEKLKVVCLNDNEYIADDEFNFLRDSVDNLLNQKLTFKSCFEK